MKRLFFVFAACAWPFAAVAAPGAGTLSSPIVIDAAPYVAKGTTVGKSDSLSTYSCGTQNESGPEVIYQFTLPKKARVTAWLEGDNATVDVDIHILKTASATDCVARANQIAEADLDAGTHYLAVDTFSGDTKAGPYVLHYYAIGDDWYTQPLADGVLWRARRYTNQGGGPNAVSELVVDLKKTGVSIRSLRGVDCETLDKTGDKAMAVAGVNGGYWDTGTGKCDPVSLFKSDGVLLNGNASTAMRGAFGIAPDGTPLMTRTAMGADWPEAYQAQGGGPILVDAKTIKQDAAAWAEEGLSSTDFLNATRARTFAGFDETGVVHLGGIDEVAGSTGMSMNSLATFAGTEIGLYSAVNLDGGGSTTVWVKGATPNGLVSYPTDFGTAANPTHTGSRGVSGGLFVFAPPYNWPPRFQTAPITDGAVGTTYTYDADAIDLDVNDTVTYTLVKGPPGMAIDADSGVVTFQPDVEAPAMATVIIGASDGHGGDTQQAYTLTIAGAMGDPDLIPDAGTAPLDMASSSSVDGGGHNDSPDMNKYGNLKSVGCAAAGGSASGGALGGCTVALLALALGRRRRQVVVKL